MTVFERIEKVYKELQEAILAHDIEKFNEKNEEFKKLSKEYSEKYGMIIVNDMENKTIQ